MATLRQALEGIARWKIFWKLCAAGRVQVANAAAPRVAPAPVRALLPACLREVFGFDVTADYTMAIMDRRGPGAGCQLKRRLSLAFSLD